MSSPKSGPKSADSDPSMDDILSSIRKIISDDEARTHGAASAAGRLAVTPPQVGLAAKREDVLLLTDLVEEPRREPASTVPLPRIDPSRAAEMPQPALGPIDTPLLAGSVAASAGAALSRLEQAVQDSAPQPHIGDPGPAVSASGKTVEDLVKEMLRPMLKDWLDRNLPPLVERSVEREIARLTRR